MAFFYRFIVIVAAIILLFAPDHVIAQWGEPDISIWPADPSIADSIVVDVQGTWNNGCTPYYVSHNIDGDVTNIVTTNAEVENPGSICTQAFTPYHFVLIIGELPHGHYMVAISGALRATDQFSVWAEQAYLPIVLK